MRVLVVFGLVCAACQGPDPIASLVAVDPEPAGPNCPNGGVAVHAGPDLDGDGTLDAGEITSTSYVCSPDPPPAPAAELVHISQEPAGPHCEHGGVAIETGADLDQDGVLDAGEVSSITYLCTAYEAPQLVRVVLEPAGPNCADGGQAIQLGADTNDNGLFDDTEVTATSYVCAGATGTQALVRVDVEPAGSNCSAGGSAIHVGLDQNHDGQLEDAEIQTTSFLCGAVPLPTVIHGDYVIHNDFDLASLAGVTKITGNLAIDSSTLTSVDLPNLHEIGGMLRCITCSSLSQISFPNLDAVFAIRLQGHPLAAVTFPPALVPASDGELGLGEISNATFPLPAVHSASVIVGGPNLLSISLPSLVSGGVGIYAPNLQGLSLPALANGSVALGDNSLTTLVLPSLTNGSVSSGNSTMSTLSLPELVAGNVLLEATPQLANVSIPNLAAGSIQLKSAIATVLEFPKLTSAYHVSITDAPALTTLSLPLFDPAPTDDATVVVSNVPSLTSVELPRLQNARLLLSNAAALPSLSAPKLQWTENLLITDTAALTTITLPLLAGARQIEIQRNAALTTLSVPALSYVSYQTIITDNPMLAACFVAALEAYLPNPKENSGNDESATCL